jgi:hypothetical protein
MKESQVEEIRQIIEQSGQGNYVPLLIIAGVIVFCFSLIVLILVAWYKKDQRITDQRLNDHAHLLNEVTKAQIQNSKILAVHEAELNQLKESV